MRTRYGYILLLAAVVLLTACQELPRYFVSEKPLAAVGERELTVRELTEVLPQGLSESDSAAYAKVFIDRWVRKQLKLREAEQLFSSSEADIDRQVEEYRQALLIRKLEQFYIDRQVDTTFTAEQIADYYNSHRSEFRLDHTIVKGRVVRLPKSYRQTRRLRELMASSREREQQDFRDLCLKNDFELNEFDNGWVPYTDFLALLPIVRKNSHDELLKSQKVQEMTDGHSLYYFTIDQVCRKGEPTPLEMVEPTIRRILFNRRQQQLIRDHEEGLYQQAIETEGIKLYSFEEEADEK